jgi:hypothetical protein
MKLLLPAACALGLLFNPENGGSTLLQKAEKLQRAYTAPYSRSEYPRVSVLQKYCLTVFPYSKVTLK